MLEIVQQAFIETAVHLVKLIVPITGITIAFKLFFAGLYGGRRDN